MQWALKELGRLDLYPLPFTPTPFTLYPLLFPSVPPYSLLLLLLLIFILTQSH